MRCRACDEIIELYPLDDLVELCNLCYNSLDTDDILSVQDLERVLEEIENELQKNDVPKLPK